MAVYRWQGIDKAGRSQKGVRDADNAKVVRALLRRDGILATSIEEDSVARTRLAGVYGSLCECLERGALFDPSNLS